MEVRAGVVLLGGKGGNATVCAPVISSEREKRGCAQEGGYFFALQGVDHRLKFRGRMPIPE